jgi:molecular chaperone DnaK
MLTRHQEPYPIRSIKRQMGFNVEIPHADKKMRPEEVSAEILKFLKNCAEELSVDRFGRDADGSPAYSIDRAIVTIPAWFDQPRIEATRKAAELAGLKTLELLHEPTAAATYYCWKHKIQNGNFLVYDLGGGTFDVSVMRRTKGSFEVLGIAGDIVLGGDTFDMALAEYICKHLNDSGKYNMNLDVAHDPKDKARFDYFVWKAEGIKTSLSLENQVLFADAACPLPDKNGNSIHVELKITRPEFEKIIAPHIDRTIDQICQAAIENAKKKAEGTFKGLEDIDYILLVGGSTWIPYVKKTVREKMCACSGASNRARCTDVMQDEPDECVALGAALQAAVSGGLIFRDVENKVSLHLKGAAVVSDEEYKIKGYVFRENPEAEKQDSPFKGYSLTLKQDGGIIGDIDIGTDGSFAFEEIYLDNIKASKVSLVLADPSGKTITEFSRKVGRGEGIGVTTPPINSQEIWIITVDAKGNKQKLPVIKTGESLPCEVNFILKTSNPKFVKFIISQGDVEIKQVSHEFGRDIPSGSKIEFGMQMDNLGNIIMRSKIEGLDPFVVELQPPPPPPPPTKKDLETITAEYNKHKENLPRPKQAVMDVKFKQVSRDLDSALAHGDFATAAVRIAELRQMIADIAGATEKPLVPARDEFDTQVRETRDAVNKVEDKLGQKAEELLKNIDAQILAAGKAYQERDQQALSECCDALKSYKSFADKHAETKTGSGDRPPMNLLVPAVAQQLISELQELQSRASDPTFRQEAQRHIETLENIPSFIATERDAAPYIPKLQAAIKTLDNIKRALHMPTSAGNSGLPEA